MTITKFATALSIFVVAAQAQDPTEFGLNWDTRKEESAVRLEEGNRDVTVNRLTSDWTLNMLGMSGWFLKPQTPLDGCFDRGFTQPKTVESDRTWWQIQEEKERTEAQIRVCMNASFGYQDCRTNIEQLFIAQAKRDRNLDATLDSELLSLDEYENPIRPGFEVDPEATDLYAQAFELKQQQTVELSRYNLELAEITKAKRDKVSQFNTWEQYLIRKRAYDYAGVLNECNAKAYSEMNDLIDRYPDSTELAAALSTAVKALPVSLSSANSALSSAYRAFETASIKQGDYTYDFEDAAGAARYATAARQTSLSAAEAAKEALLSTQRTVTDTAQSAYEAAQSAYLEACPYDVMVKTLLPTYKDYFTKRERFYKSQETSRLAFETSVEREKALFESTSERERAGFRFRAPTNPYQSIVNILKGYRPGSNDASVASSLARLRPEDIGAAMQSYEIETQDSNDPFGNKVDQLGSTIDSELIGKAREQGEIQAQGLTDSFWASYERGVAPLRSKRDSAEKAYNSANLLCESTKSAWELALQAFESYTNVVPEQRTQESEYLLTLSDLDEKAETATKIEILSDPRGSYITQQKSLGTKLATALRSYQTAEAKCTSTRQTFYLADIGFAAYNQTISECEELKDRYSGEVEGFQAPHKQACEEEKRIIEEWEGKLDEAKAERERVRSDQDLFNAISDSYAKDECDNNEYRTQESVYYKLKANRAGIAYFQADFNVRKIEKYLKYLRTQTGDDCAIAAAYQVEIDRYREPVCEETTYFAEPACEGWCKVGSFNYRDYPYEGPCTPTQSSFDDQLDRLDIYSQSSRDEFNLCTGTRFSLRVPEDRFFVEQDYPDRESFRWETDRYFEDQDYFTPMKEYIDISWRNIEKPVFDTTEIRDLEQRAAKIPKIKIEGTVITQLNRLALSYTQCERTDVDSCVPPLEQKLVELDLEQIDHELHDSYWAEVQKTGSAGNSRIGTSSPWFYERVESKMNVTEVAGRQLQTFNGDDFIMIDELREKDRPSRLTTCTENNLLTGFQVFYGEYDEIAGSAHGDLSTDCTNILINQEVWEVIFYGSASGQYIEGMEIILQPLRDVQFPYDTISVGTVGQVGQKRRSVRMPNNNGSGNNYVYHFFGFKSTSRNKVLTNVSVITYDPEALFRSRYDFSSLSDATRVKSAYLGARTKVAKLLLNRALLELPQAYPSSAGESAKNEHVDDIEEANMGAIIACVIGIIIIIAMCVCCCCMMKKGNGMMSMTGSGSNTSMNNSRQQIQVNQSSFRSGNQAKLDDIM